MKKLRDLDVMMKEYEKDLNSHNKEINKLNATIIQKNVEIKELTEDLEMAKDTISKQQKEINLLKPFKYLWNKFIKFLKNRVRYYRDKSYNKVYEELKKDNVLRQ